MPKLNLIEDEYRLIKLNVEKLYKLKCEGAKGIARIKHEYTTTNSLFEKFKKAAAEKNDVVLNRRELRTIEKILNTMVDLINSRTIPGYMHRIDTQPERADFYREYLKRAEKTRDVTIKGLLDKVQGAL